MLRSSSFHHYRINQRIVERLELDPCQVSDTVTGSSVDPPYTRHTIKIQGTSERRLRRNKRIIEELEGRCAEVDAAIATMADGRLAKMLLLRFVDGAEPMSWEEIGPLVHRHPDVCRKEVKKYLDSLDVVQTEGFKKRTKRKAKGIR